MTDPERVAEIAAELTKAARRAIPQLNSEWRLCQGRLRVDCYGLWWGRLHKFGLVDSPRWPGSADLYKMRLTPLGLAVRNHLLATAQEGGK